MFEIARIKDWHTFLIDYIELDIMMQWWFKLFKHLQTFVFIF